MNWAMKAPCADCPFRREGGIRLTLRRVAEIADGLLDSQGHTFMCHETTGVKGGRHRDEREQLHCAGALIFAEKNDNATQAMRIAERLRMYDHREVLKHADLVFNTREEMLASALDSGGRSMKVYTVVPKNRRYQTPPWHVCEVQKDGSLLVLSEHETREDAIDEEMKLRRAAFAKREKRGRS